MKVAVVTRECGSDVRYGMGRSWTSVAKALERRGTELQRIDGDSLDVTALEEFRRMERWLAELGPSIDRAVASTMARAWAVGTLAARRIAGGGFCAVDCHDFMCAAAARWQARRIGHALPPWGYHQHSFNAGWRALDEFYGPLDPGLRRAVRRCERRIAAAARWVIFPASSALDQCAADLGLTGRMENWTVLRHPVTRPVLITRDEARATLGVRPDETILLGIGQFVPLKRFDRLIRALGVLPVNCKLWLLGEGDQATLLALAREIGVADRVALQAVDDVSPWLAAADVYVSTSQTEAFGMANAEAVSAGLPCLIAATGASPELFSAHALLLAPDLSNLEAELCRIALDATARRELAARTRGFADCLPAPDVVAANLQELYSGCGSPPALAYDKGNAWRPH